MIFFFIFVHGSVHICMTYMDTFATQMILGANIKFIACSQHGQWQRWWSQLKMPLAVIISVALEDFVSSCSFPIGRLFGRPRQLNAKFLAPSDVYRRQSLLSRPWQLTVRDSQCDVKPTFWDFFCPWPKISWVYVGASPSKRESVWVEPGDAKAIENAVLCYHRLKLNWKVSRRARSTLKTSTSTWTGSRGDLNDEPRRVPANSQLIFQRHEQKAAVWCHQLSVL